MRALVVEVDLASPLIDNGHPLHIDSVLVQAITRRQCSPVPNRMTPLEEIDRITRLGLPLAIASHDGAVCSLSSAAQEIGPASPEVVWQMGRRDPEDWDRLANPVQVAAGPGKDKREHNAARSVAGLRWYLWGRRADVMDLLRLLWGHPDRPHGFVGSKRRSGSGEITAWRCYAGEHEAERCWLDQGRAIRHLPEAWVEQAERWGRGASEPPYWHPSLQRPVPWIGTRVRLSPGAYAALTRAACP